MLISKIRKYSWVVVGFIALALVAFLLQDATNSNTGMFNKNKIPDYANVSGQEITQDEFAERRGQSVLEYLTFNNQVLAYEQGQYQLDPRTQFGISEKAWTEFVNEKIVEVELEKLGITVTEDEFSNLIYGPDPHPVIKNYYIGLSQTGQYDASVLPTWVSQISDQEAQQNNPQMRQEYYQFISREKVAKRDYMQSKYMSLFTQATYVPEWMAKRNYTMGNTRANFTVITLPYDQIADSTITVSDAELKSYYNEHKNKYKQTEGRVVEYVSWEFTPTGIDSATTLANLMASVEKMKAAKNDSIFIATRSEDQDRYGYANYSRNDLYQMDIDSNVVDSFYSKSVGSLVGPYFSSGSYKMAKLKNRQNMLDSVKAQHIVIAINENRDSVTAKNLVDSIQGLLAAGGDFAQLATTFSDDNESKPQGGDLGWVTPSVGYVPEFKDYLFKAGPVGKVGVVKAPYGYHIVEITEVKNRRDFVTIAVLSKAVAPGKETIDSLEKVANSFYDKYQTPETFEQGVTDMKLFKRVTQPLTKNQYEIPGLADTREIIIWAFDAKKDEFKYFNMADRVVVAYVKDVKVDGIAELENIKELVEREVIMEKKGEMLTQKFNDAMKSGASMEAIAAKLGMRVDSVSNASMASPSAPMIGREPKVIGSVFGLEAGKMTKPVAGNRGVFLAQLINITPAPETTDYTMNKNQLMYSFQNKYQPQQQQQAMVQQTQGLLFELKDKAEVVDNRYQFGD